MTGFTPSVDAEVAFANPPIPGSPALFVWDTGSWKFANDEARRLIEAEDWISLKSGSLKFADLVSDRLFRARAASALSTDSGDYYDGRRLPVILRDTEHTPAGVALVIRDSWPSLLGAVGVNRPLVFTIIVTEEGRRSAQVSAIAELGELTPAEIALVSHLLSGLTAQQIAKKTARGLPTIRWHIRNILTKLGITRIDELYRIAGMLP
jgi:DNA-binding CsgD family transcriptional regulator